LPQARRRLTPTLVACSAALARSSIGWAGCPLDRCRPRLQVPLACEWSHHGDRALVLPARLDDSGGRTMALPCPAVGSADLATGGRVDGAVLMPPRCGTLAAGTVVPFRPWWEGTSC